MGRFQNFAIQVLTSALVCTAAAPVRAGPNDDEAMMRLMRPALPPICFNYLIGGKSKDEIFAAAGSNYFNMGGELRNGLTTAGYDAKIALSLVDGPPRTCRVTWTMRNPDGSMARGQGLAVAIWLENYFKALPGGLTPLPVAAGGGYARNWKFVAGAVHLNQSTDDAPVVVVFEGKQ